MDKKWWHHLTAYQIYTRSFCDSNGDGIGDFQGIISKLDYLQELGVGAIWISPFNDSPNYDNGYDISDYYAILKDFGTTEDLEELVKECEKRDIIVMMDLVLNHSSNEHPWFLEAAKDRDRKYHDYYIWEEGTEDQPPQGEGAFFGGNVWEWTLEFYSTSLPCVIRGGSCYDSGSSYPAKNRISDNIGSYYDGIGFRVGLWK